MKKARSKKTRSFEKDRSELIDLVELLSNARSLNEVFIVLESHMRHIGIRRTRFYRFERSPSTDDGLLYSVWEHGHESDQVAESIILSSSGSAESDYPLEKSDKFWCKELRQPVVVLVDEHVSFPLKVHAVGDGPPHLRVPLDECEDQPFAEGKSIVWIDFPLFIGDQFIGKITADLGDEKDLTKQTKQKRTKRVLAQVERLISSGAFRTDCLRLNNTLRVAAPHLEFWETQQQRNRLNELASILAGCRSPKDVMEKCVNAIPSERMFNCYNADILTFHRDSLGRKRLILRATTVEHLKDACDSINYDLQDSVLALTEWAFETSTSLRLVDLLNPEVRAAQLSDYQRSNPSQKIEWRESIPLSFRHESLMIVPFGTEEDEFAGVLRLADRIDDGNGASFSELDQSLAETAVRQHIVPALRATNAVFGYQALETQLNALDAIANEQRHETLPELAKGIANIFNSLVPSDLKGKGRGKRLLLSRVDETRSPQSFRLMQLPANKNELEISGDALRKSFPLAGTLTGHALNSDDPIHFTDLAHAQSQGLYMPVVNHARSVIATQIAFRGVRFGTVSILSSHYDLSTVPTLPLVLRTLARQAARILVQDRIQAVNAILSGVRHDLNPVVSRINTIVGGSANDFSQKDLYNLFRNLSQLLDSHCRSGPLPVAVFERNLFDVDVNEVFLSVVECIRIMYPAEFKRRTLRVDGFPGLPAVTRLYRPFLTAILINVLSNAFSHSKVETEIRVNVGHRDGFLSFSIENVVSDAANVSAITRVMNVSLDNTLDNPIEEISPYNRGVVNARRFAKLHRVRHGGTEVDGDVTHHYDDSTRRITVELSIPEPREPVR